MKDKLTSLVSDWLDEKADFAEIVADRHCSYGSLEVVQAVLEEHAFTTVQIELERYAPPGTLAKVVLDEAFRAIDFASIASAAMEAHEEGLADSYQEAQLADFYGGSGPVTLDEQHTAAYKAKKG